jgi:hypothetical protein
VVNADLGGKAVDSNLIPTPRLINGEYYRAFESPLKTIYRANKPIWMMAIVNYRSDFPDFPSEFQATGGGMKFENNAWVPDPTNNVPAFNKRIDPPMPEEVMINHLPAAEADWYLIVNLTPIARPVLRIVRDHKGGTTITGKPQLKALIDAHAGSYGYDAGYISNMKNRVDEANINFAP